MAKQTIRFRGGRPVVADAENVTDVEGPTRIVGHTIVGADGQEHGAVGVDLDGQEY